jgi:hypothetical protein
MPEFNHSEASTMSLVFTSKRSLLAAIIISSSIACSASDTSVAPETVRVSSVSASSITAIDISNGVTGGGARTISSAGIVLGKIGTYRGWWQSPFPTFTLIDEGYVQGGNRNADAGGGQGTAILSTNGGAPWSNVTLASPPGINAGATLARDINDFRVLVGSTLGSDIYPIRWDNPSAIPVRLPLPSLRYPAIQAVAKSINNTGTIVGYVYEGSIRNKGKSSTIYEAIVWSGSSVEILPLPPGGTTQLASNVNDAGVISGITEGSHPIRWTPRVGGGYDVAVSSLDVGGSDLDTGIDACGRVTGGSDSGAWVWDGISAPVILPGLAGSGIWGQVSDINEAGVAVGSSMIGTSKGSRVTKATMWTGLPSCSP